MFKSRYVYMLLGLFSLLIGIVLLLNVPTLTFAGNSGPNDDGSDHDIFIPIISDMSTEQTVSNKSVDDSKTASAAEKERDVINSNTPIVTEVGPTGPIPTYEVTPLPIVTEVGPTGPIPIYEITPFPTSITDYEDTVAYIEEDMAQQTTIHWAGPETRGKEYVIAGKKIQLPPDAELDGGIVAVSCEYIPIPKELDIQYCPGVPAINIIRDRSSDSGPSYYSISIESKTGRIWPQFTKEEPEYQEYIDSFGFLINEIGEENVVDIAELAKKLEPFLTPSP